MRSSVVARTVSVALFAGTMLAAGACTTQSGHTGARDDSGSAYPSNPANYQGPATPTFRGEFPPREAPEHSATEPDSYQEP
jgi:hypothetical protein